MNAGAVVARNAKTVVAALGGVINVLAVAAALFAYAPAGIAGYGTVVMTVLEVLRSVNVWLVRNEPVLAASAQAGAELVTAIEHPAPAPADASSAAVQVGSS